MRISTSQIVDSGGLNIQKNQSALYKLNNQLATGRRVVTPQDDPVAAAQALIVAQSIGVNTQHTTNQGQAMDQLGLVDTQLTTLENTLQNIRERVVQAGSTTLSFNDRGAIASELESRLSEMIGIANSANGTGEYLFSGYSGNIRPFAVSGDVPVAPATTSPIGYFGDQGERLLQVSSSRQIAVSVPGNQVFLDAKQGNGSFVTGTGGNLTVNPTAPPAFTSNGNNRGTAQIDAGSLTDSGLWNAAGNPGNFMIRFSVTTSAGGVATSTYQIYDNTDPTAPVALLATPATFTPGQKIALQKTTTTPVVDYGASINVQGQPSDGDSLTVQPSTNQSLFQTVQNVIAILRSSVGGTTYSTTQYANDLGSQLTNIDQGLENVGKVLSNVGSRMQEIDSLKSASADINIQYQSTLSGLQDLDMVKAISDYTKQNAVLDASQKTFAKISELSLFKYL